MLTVSELQKVFEELEHQGHGEAVVMVTFCERYTPRHFPLSTILDGVEDVDGVAVLYIGVSPNVPKSMNPYVRRSIVEELGGPYAT